MFLVLALASSSFAYDGTLAPGQTLDVHDVNGSIRVRIGDKLSIRATKTARTGDPNAVVVKVEPRSNGLVVCVRYPPDTTTPCSEHQHTTRGSDNDTKVDFDVTVPHGIALVAGTVNGSVDAVTDGSIAASTVNGTIHVEGRDVRSASTVNGSIDLHVSERPTGALHANTVNGSIEVSLPAGTGVNVHAHTLTGDIDAGGLNVERPRYGPGATVRGTLGDGAVQVSLATINGSITLHR